MKPFRLRYLGSALVPYIFPVILASAAFGGTITYSYTGNQFNDLRNGGTCPPDCNVVGSFTLVQPLGADLPEGTIVTPVAFSISSGGITLIDGEPTDTSRLT
jgi:hypothetical protein